MSGFSELEALILAPEYKEYSKTHSIDRFGLTAKQRRDRAIAILEGKDPEDVISLARRHQQSFLDQLTPKDKQ